MNTDATQKQAQSNGGVRHVDMSPRMPVRFEFTPTGQFLRVTQSHVGGADDLSPILDGEMFDQLLEAAKERIRIVDAYMARRSGSPLRIQADDLCIRGG